MIEKEIIVVCKPLFFYSKNDELLMQQWLKKIKCINKIDRADNDLLLHITSDNISNEDFDNLIGLFARYKFNSDQLKIFINEKNEDLFYDISGAYGNHHNVYPFREHEAATKEEIILTCTPLEFYTKADENLMFRLIKKIKCIDKYYGIKQVLYLCIRSNKISNKYLADLRALFTRYKFEREQLKAFMNASNKHLFEN